MIFPFIVEMLPVPLLWSSDFVLCEARRARDGVIAMELTLSLHVVFCFVQLNFYSLLVTAVVAALLSITVLLGYCLSNLVFEMTVETVTRGVSISVAEFHPFESNFFKG